MKTTYYFEEQVLRKRPFIKLEWCEQAVRMPERIEIQEDGRRRYWIYIPEAKPFTMRSLTATFEGTLTMKLHYYADTNSLYIDLSEKTSVESREVSPGIVLDFDDAGHLCGIDVDHASENLDLSRLEAVSLPIKTASLVHA